jgi:hypothetical protein
MSIFKTWRYVFRTQKWAVRYSSTHYFMEYKTSFIS